MDTDLVVAFPLQAHESSDREHVDRIDGPGLVLKHLEKPRRESYSEFVDLHSRQLRRNKVPELMEEYDEAEDENEHQDTHH